MSNRLIFTSTKLLLSGKKGILRPDSEGYYTMPIGAFNCMNSSGEVYTDEGIYDMFAESSSFKRRINDGKLFGEWGHPVQAPGESMADYVNRASLINDKETCVFFKDIWNEDKIGHLYKDCRGIDESSIITMGRFKPHGLRYDVFERALDDPNVNIAMSVRNMGVDRIYRGRTYVTVKKIFTYDVVGEQGVGSAEKHASLHLENCRVEVTKPMLDRMRNNLSVPGLRMESANTLREILVVADNFYAAKQGTAPSYQNW